MIRGAVVAVDATNVRADPIPTFSEPEAFLSNVRSEVLSGWFVNAAYLPARAD